MLMGGPLYFTTVQTYDLSFVFIIHTRQFLEQYFSFAIKTAEVVDVRKYHLLDLGQLEMARSRQSSTIQEPLGET